MPERGVGKALRKALSGEKEEAATPRGEALLLNEHRRAVFEFLCLKPCATPGSVAGALQLSPNAVAWHVQKLVEGGFLRRGAGEEAYPDGLIHPADGPVFQMLGRDMARRVLLAVMEEPGQSLEPLADVVEATRQTVGRAVGALARLGFVSVVRDGRANRYYPTELLAKKRDANGKRVRNFCENLLRRIESEGLKAQVLRRSEQAMIVRLGDRQAAPVLRVGTDPYATVLASQESVLES
jgi:DNA-binding MarR family transcriptional regulator